VILELERWYDGYCFDGLSRSFNPFPVLSSLRDGSILQHRLDASSGTNWLGLTPRALIEALPAELQLEFSTDAAKFDVADLESQTVRVVPLLLQTGLLSLVQANPQLCRPPNEYARQSLQHMVATVLAVPPASISPFAAALRNRDRKAFMQEVVLLFAKNSKF
jgi:hypothetical protein